MTGKWLALACLWLMPAWCHANQEAEKQKMAAELDIIKHSFEVKYAPSDWKKSYIGWDLEAQIELAKDKVFKQKSITTKDFQYILRDFINSTQDHHTKVNFYSTEKAYLPFRVHEVNGKYIVTWIRKGLDQIAEDNPSDELIAFLNMPLQTGDEIIEMNGKPVHEVVEDIKIKYLGHSKAGTHQRIAEMLLTARLAAMGMDVPSGPVSLTVRHGQAKKPSKYYLEWFYSAEQINNWLLPQNGDAYSRNSNPFLQRQMWTPYHDLLKGAYQGGPVEDEDEHPNDSPMGAILSVLPTLGKIQWESSSTNFDAYVFEAPDHRPIGFLRIPHYLGSEQHCEDLEQIIDHLENHSEALIIDQMNNPGGSFFYMWAILSMLTSKPMDGIQERLTLTQEDVARAFKNLLFFETIESEQDIEEKFQKDLEGYSLSLDVVEGLVSHCNFVIDQWKAGKLYSDPEPIFGQEKIYPNPRANYTHPILILVNNLVFSCGDIVPAILQDNKRAKVMGMATAGAGGCVINVQYYNRFGIDKLNLTGSMCYRRNQKPLENLGVTPDIICPFTVRDLTDNYSDFVKAILKEI